MEITVEEIRKKGKALGLPYVQSLSLFLFEKILCWVSNSPLKEDMWLKPEEFQIDGTQKRTVPNQTIYYMKKISYQALEEAMGNLFGRKKDGPLQIVWAMQFFDSQIEIVLHMKLAQVEAPYKIIIRPVWQQEQFSTEGIYGLQLLGNEKICYREYPMELNLAECFYDILDRLELIGTMQPYKTAYDILSSYAVDGRRIYLDMMGLLEVRAMSSLEKRWKTVLGYESYTYMKKRWNRHNKGLKKERPSWEEVIRLLDEFFSPLLQAVVQDDIFIADWMPHLGRYLD